MGEFGEFWGSFWGVLREFGESLGGSLLGGFAGVVGGAKRRTPSCCLLLRQGSQKASATPARCLVPVAAAAQARDAGATVCRALAGRGLGNVVMWLESFRIP